MYKSLYVLTTTLVLFISTLSAESYQWIDNDGNVIYSQTPPTDDRTVRKIKSAPSPPASSQRESVEMRESLDTQAKKFDRREEERKKARQIAKTQKEENAILKQKCETAKNNLDVLTNRPPNTLFKLPTGEYKRFTYDELLEERGKFQQYIELNCKGRFR